MSLAFLVATLVAVVTPGSGVVYTLSAALTQGRRASVLAAFGCTLGIVPHVVATISGLAALVHASALAFQVLKYLGVAYLLYLAWATLRDRGALVVDDTRTAPRSAARVITSAVLINFLNPKLTIFFVAFLPQFVTAGEPDHLLRMVALSGVFMLVTFVVFVAYGLCAAAVRQHVLGRPRVMDWTRRVFAVSFAALGVGLAVTD
ncbi:LysE family translocator [Goodfellowiella coeruleoviolacea]|uniref:Threonine/homoserine/homoserine lactone efflux protein n=1 Tax=Goodfellowiella coeruleoviolacea TaxID=334858 RepID=A0AAE3GPQ0_9PSEU|nr:LysE family translocator [Goodfellowiella coeruleoviolacea]MCP2169903.1 Threonine/homoserine/homoserine lactone efflux protein [Goodfellowiella coeruleoviolacea]